MPLPLIAATDEEILPALNLVLVGYACLIFLPRWRHTPAVTLALVTFYSAIYSLLLLHRLALSTAPLPPISFDSLDHIAALFADRAVLFAGWDHYIAFDLFVARHVVLDAQARGVPHLLAASIVPIVLIAGPAGLALYMLAVVPLHTLCGGGSGSGEKAAAKTKTA